MSNPGLTYEVKVTGASQGASEIGKVADAAKRTGEASGKAAPATKSLGEALASLGGRNNDAKDVLEGLTTAARGGEGAVFGLTKAFKGFRELLNGGFAALGPGGILVAGLGVLVGLLPKVIELFKGSARSAEELAAESKKAADEVKQLGQQRLEALSAGFAAANDAAKKANMEFERTLQLQKRLNEAARNSELAENPERAKEINAKYDAKDKALKLSSKEFAAAQADQIVSSATSNQEDAFNAEVAAKKKLIDLLQEETLLTKYLASPVAKYSAAVDADERESQRKMRQRLENITSQKPEASEEVATRIKESQRAADYVAKARAEQADAQAEVKNEKIGQSAEKDSEQRIDRAKARTENRDKLTAAKQRQANAGDRSEFLAATKDVIAAQEAADGLEKLGDTAEQAKPDFKPVVEASQQTTGKVSEFAQQSDAAIKTTAAAMAEQAANVPPPIDLSPLATAQLTYHQANMDRHQKSTEAIAALQRQLNNLAQQLANSRSQ